MPELSIPGGRRFGCRRRSFRSSGSAIEGSGFEGRVFAMLRCSVFAHQEFRFLGQRPFKNSDQS